MARSYSKTEVPNSLPLAIGLESADLLVSAVALEIHSVYLIGSSVPRIVEGRWKKGGDLDLAVFVAEDFRRGFQLVDEDVLDELGRELGKRHAVSVGFSYNGLPYACDRSAIIVDVIPTRESDIKQRFPQVLIDMCNRDNIHLYGRRVLDPLMNCPVDEDTVVRRMQLTESYLEREMARKDMPGHFAQYLLKCFRFSVELAVGRSVPIESIEATLAASTLPAEERILLERAYKDAAAASEELDLSRMLAQLKVFNNGLIRTLRHSGFVALDCHTDD